MWQGILILLPVALLAGVGLYSLREDRALAEQEAKARAQDLAEEIAHRIWDRFTTPVLPNTNVVLKPAAGSPEAPVAFLRIDSRGQLLFPPPYSRPPAPAPLDLAGLNAEQVQLWQAARTAEYSDQDPTLAPAAWRAFLAASPPDKYAAAAEYALGLTLRRAGNAAAAREAFARVIDHYPQAIGESGLRLRPLAAWQWLQLAVRNSAQPAPATSESAGAQAGTNGPGFGAGRPQLAGVEGLCEEAILHPTWLSPLILELASQIQTGPAQPNPRPESAWSAVWANHELARKLYESMTKSLGATLVERAVRKAPAQCFWLTGETNWLNVLLTAQPESRWLVCFDENEARRAVGEAMTAARPVPSYFGARIQLAGRNLAASFPAGARSERADSSAGALRRGSGAALGSAAALMATASRMTDNEAAINVQIFLTDPASFYTRQRARTLWFGLLIAAATAAAFAGLAAAWRAFQRQLRLGELKNNFVSSVSHELRAPIASVRLLAEGLERGRVQSEEKRAEYFRFIVQECRRLSALIENVLDFSRIEQGRKQYEMEPTDLCALVEQTVRIMEPSAAERQIKIVRQLPAGADTLHPHLDGRAIQQALVNLIDNALKHSPAGSTVTVGVEVNMGDGALECWGQGTKGGTAAVNSTPQNSITPSPRSGRLRLWVEDHGDGIPPEEHERIFERFYRCGSELRRETQGVGIGLSIVKHVAEAHHGTVRVESEPGKGSRFTLELPTQPGDRGLVD